MTIPKGKGIYIWHLSAIFGGDPEKITQYLVDNNYDHVAIKAQDGAWSYLPVIKPNYTQQDCLAELVPLLKAAGIQVLLWSYNYGTSWSTPSAELATTLALIDAFEPDAWVIDGEHQYKLNYGGATFYAKGLATAAGGIPIGLSSYRYPSYHPEFPWKEFLAHCDFHYPQVYWEGSYNPAYQLQKSFDELIGKANLPYIPVGPCYERKAALNGWSIKPEDVTEFQGQVVKMGLPGISWWSLEHGLNAVDPDVAGSYALIEAFDHFAGTPTTPPALTLEERVERLEGFHQ